MAINWRKKRAIAALLSEANVKAAAAKAGVGESTIHRWLEDSQFQEALARAEGEIIDAASRLLLKGQRLALDVLLEIMETANETNRRLAAVAWLELSLKLRELSTIEKRLEVLENKL